MARQDCDTATSERDLMKTKTVVLYVRHGTTATTGLVLPGRAAGLHLSEQGIAEAAMVGQRLSELGTVKAVYASPLERTQETAAQIAKALELPVEIDQGLLECDFGDWTGRSLEQLRALEDWDQVQNSPSSFCFPGGESFIGLRDRMALTAEVLASRHMGQVIVAVSHADPIKVALGDALGSSLDMVQRIHVAPCSVSAVAYGQGSPAVLTMGSTCSLVGLALLGPVSHDPSQEMRAHLR